MADSTKPTFLIDAGSDPVLIRVEGRASFQNSAGLRDFIQEMIRHGNKRLAIDFRACSSMDSTFLGVLAGAAIELRKQQPPGSLVLMRLGQRNLELVRNLGLHRLLTLDDKVDLPAAPNPNLRPLGGYVNLTEIESARLVLEAHENLVSADSENKAKFEDVLTFLRNRISQG